MAKCCGGMGDGKAQERAFPVACCARDWREGFHSTFKRWASFPESGLSLFRNALFALGVTPGSVYGGVTPAAVMMHG